jgi:hypothetical protein
MSHPKGVCPQHILERNERLKNSSRCARGHVRKPGVRCLECRKITSRQYKVQHQESLKAWHKAHHLLHTYELTLDEFNRKKEAQKNCCAICNRLMSSPCVDHDHETRTVRDLLCGNCNRALGLFQDDALIVAKAAEYLRKWKV